MKQERREVLKAGGGIGLASLLMAAGWLEPGEALAQQSAWNRAAFEAKSMADALKALGGSNAPASADIVIQAPDIAENGAVVPITVNSKLAKTEQVAVLVEKNPSMLAASFEFMPGTEPTVTTRVKMAQTSNVYALVKADGRFHIAFKEVKVTLGGCGG